MFYFQYIALSEFFWIIYRGMKIYDYDINENAEINYMYTSTLMVWIFEYFQKEYFD